MFLDLHFYHMTNGKLVVDLPLQKSVLMDFEDDARNTKHIVHIASCCGVCMFFLHSEVKLRQLAICANFHFH